MAATRKNTKPASGARGGKTSSVRQPTQKLNQRISRSIWGLLLLGLSVLMLTSLIVLPDESYIGVIRYLQQGIGGVLCLVFPFFVGWIGGTLAFTPPSSKHTKHFLLVLALLLLLLTGIQLFDRDETIRDAVLKGNSAQTYLDYLRAALERNWLYPYSGGAAGALLAWPLFVGLGVAGSVVVVIALVITDLVALTGISVADIGDAISQGLSKRQEEGAARRAERKAHRAEYKEARAMEQLRMQQVNVRPEPHMADPQWMDGLEPTSKIVPVSKQPKRETKKKQTFEEMPESYPEPWPQPMPPQRMYVETVVPHYPNMPWDEAPQASYPAYDQGPPLPWNANGPGPTREAWRDMPPILEFPTGREREAAQPSPGRGQPSLYIETITPSYSGAKPTGGFPWEDEPWDEEPLDDAPWDEEQEIEFVEEAEMYVPVEASPRRKAAPKSPSPAETESATERRLDHTPVTLPVQQQAVLPPVTTYRFPPFDLLNPPLKSAKVDTRKEDERNANKLIETLQSFGIQARVLNVTHGPAITRYELQPAPGVKVARIVSLVDDIALNMAAAGVRIEAPIPGKAAVGIEIPNESIATVVLREVLESDEAQNHNSALACALGKDIAGRRVIADLARMPHVLIAGATGSGKSVCINTLINSLIFRSSPEEVRLILIDPKVVELSVYNGIPHLLMPVVTDPKKASGALSWAVAEMDKRYKSFADRGVRDIKGFNAALGEEDAAMPQIVVIIDELADLMMVAPGEVEDSICRLAQLARAAGIHLVIATQRPSVNVITGVIKANIPSRVAFAVSSQVDSRTILDSAGAEKLLGKGDMLYAPQGTNKPVRVQGCFVSDEEVSRVVEYVKANHDAEYDEDLIEHVNNTETNATETQDEAEAVADDLLPQAIEIALETGQASISMLQRRLRVGYARAGRLIDEMARRGIISQAEGAKPREVLMTREEYRRLFEMES
ncbi:MAG: FtsK/SpoIIIE domain-containing protein [Clostridia bacterium]|nr:FtsK/SpoIIIE domain-containing protein [Clostridia bacterium]